MANALLHTIAASTLIAALVGCQPGSTNDSNNRQNLSDCDIKPYQTEMLDQVNNARASARTCGDTDFPPAPALAYQCDLNTAAERHSQDMATNNFFSHTSSDGLKLRNRVDATGYQWSTIGENIAAGQSTVAGVMDGWLKSEVHCRNIMNDQFEEFGVNRVVNESADYQQYWTQVFGAQR
jgi:uncharacterized protein YkwD